MHACRIYHCHSNKDVYFVTCISKKNTSSKWPPDEVPRLILQHNLISLDLVGRTTTQFCLLSFVLFLFFGKTHFSNISYNNSSR